MLHITYADSYMKNGSPTHRYIVSSDLSADKAKAELAEYKKVKGSFHRETEDGKPLFFTSRYEEDNTPIALKRNGSDFYVKTDLVEQSKQIQEQATKTIGKLEGVRQYSGMSKKAIAEMACANL